MMKRIVVLLSIFFLVIGCESTKDLSIPIFDGVTYEFHGKSEHFEFKTGKVYFDEYTKRIYVSDFHKISKMGDLDNIILSIMFGDEKTDITTSSKNKLSDLSFYEGDVCDETQPNMSCEITPFDLATKENFKDIFKVKISYCTKEKCASEFFDIEYVEK